MYYIGSIPYGLIVVWLLSLSTASCAYDLPNWTTKAPQENSTFMYYLGRSAPAPSQAEAIKEAYTNAVENAIKDNYGFNTIISKESFEGIEQINTTKRVEERSKNIQIHGFELQDQYTIETKDNKVEAFVLYRYSKEEIAKEKARLEKQPDDAGLARFSSVGNDGDSEITGALSVATRPSMATIYIDNEPYGKTNAKINGLSVGQHLLRIEHISYKSIEESIIIIPASETSVVKTLQPVKRSQVSNIISVEAKPKTLKASTPEIQWGTDHVEIGRLIAVENDSDAQRYPSWRIYLGIGYGGNPVSLYNTASDYICCVLLDVAMERMLTDFIGLKLKYSYQAGLSKTDNSATGGTGEGTPNTTQSFITASSRSEVSIATPLYLTRHFYLGPEVGRAFSAITQTPRNYNYAGVGTWGSPRGGQSFQQNFYGVTFGCETSVLKGLGLYFNGAVRRYGNGGGYQGTASVQGGVGLMIGF